MLKLAAVLIVQMIALALVVPAQAAPTPLSQADKDTFDAIAKSHFATIASYQNQALQIVTVQPVDNAKMCTLEQASLTEILARKTEELALLYRYEQDNKQIDPLIGDFLRTSRLAGQYLWATANACAADHAARDGHGTGSLLERIKWQAIYRDEVLLTQLDKVNVFYIAAVKGKDRLTELSELQSLETLLTAQLIPEITGLRDIGGTVEPRGAALVARLSALEAEQADIEKRAQVELKPYTDPRSVKP